jgi:hypothetical protein
LTGLIAQKAKSRAGLWLISSVIGWPLILAIGLFLVMAVALSIYGPGSANTGPPSSTARSLIPPDMLALYQSASVAQQCPQLPWTITAAIGHIESNDNRSPGVSSAGAMGPMQFEPSTWARYGIDANGDGVANIMDPLDAVPSAAHYLCTLLNQKGGDISLAIYGYNHAQWYVDEVLQLADKLAVAGYGGVIAGGNAAQLAQRILQNPNINTSGRLVYFDLYQQANGGIPSAGVPLHADLLAVIDYIGRTFSIRISALESGGTGHTAGSAHYQGWAVDIDTINGVATNGRDAYASALLSFVMPVLPAGTSIGQSQCGPPVLMTPGVSDFPDTCDHLHIQVP